MNKDLLMIPEFEENEDRLETSLIDAIKRGPADILLLSGGIDSGLLAALNPQTPALTVTIQGFGTDVRYAQEVTEFLGMNWHHIELSTNEALAMIPDIVTHLHSYDPGILNDVAIYAAMRYGRSLGMEAVRTGDGGDDMFGGYSFSWSKDGKTLDPEYHREHLTKLHPHIHFPSDTMAESFGMTAHHPYIDQEVADLAIEMDLDLKVRSLTDMQSVGDIHYELDSSADSTKQDYWSKIILRRLARKYLPISIVRRPRADLEYGSGGYTLEQLLAEQITEKEVAELEKEGIKFWNNPMKPETRRLHARLRRIFEEQGLQVPEVRENEYGCQWCEGGVSIGRSHCATCGAWPANE